MNNYSDIIARIEDLPYWDSPPFQFTFTQKASLTLGQYPFLRTRTELKPQTNITDNILLYFKSISFSADIPKNDYQQALQLAGGTNDIPEFYAFLSNDANAIIFENPLQLNDYFNDQEFKFLKAPKQLPNKFTGFIDGKLQQTAALAGVDAVNITIQMFGQSISDDNFIAALKRDYPDFFNWKGRN